VCERWLAASRGDGWLAGSDGILSFGRGRGLAAMRARVSLASIACEGDEEEERRGNSFRIAETGERQPVCAVCVDRASVGMSILEIPSTLVLSHDPWIPGESSSIIHIQRFTSSSLFVDRERFSPLTSRFWPRISLPLKYPGLLPRRATEPHSILARFARY
jgi:hypothetical protein